MSKTAQRYLLYLASLLLTASLLTTFTWGVAKAVHVYLEFSGAGVLDVVTVYYVCGAVYGGLITYAMYRLDKLFYEH